MKYLIAGLLLFAFLIFFIGFIVGKSETRVIRANASYFDFMLRQEASTSATLEKNTNLINDIREVCYGLREAGE